MRLRGIALLGSMLFATAAHATPAEADARQQQLAMAIWAEGKRAYDLGDYKEALGDFLASYQYAAAPETLFSICQAHRQLGDLVRALQTCKSYLRNKPDAENRLQVEMMIAKMLNTLQAMRAAAAEPPQGATAAGSEVAAVAGSEAAAVAEPEAAAVAEPEAAAEPGRPWWRDSWGWVSLGAGVIAAGVGVALLVNANSLDADANGTLDERRGGELRDRAAVRRTAGVVLSAVGGVGAAFGVVKLAWSW